MESNYFLTIEEVADILKISYSRAAVIIRQLNKELKDQKKMILRGRIVRSYFYDRMGVSE